MKAKRITIKDVAEKSGVSISSVNAALTGKGRVGEIKKKEILKIATEMGYHTNRVAQSMARKPLCFGVLLPTEYGEYYYEIQAGIEFELKKLSDYNVASVILQENYHKCDNKRMDEIYRIFTESGIDVLIFCNGDRYHLFYPLLEKLDAEGLLVIAVNSDSVLSNGKKLPLITVNGTLSGRTAAEYLNSVVPSGGKVVITSFASDVKVVQKKKEGFVSYVNNETKLQMLPVLELDEKNNCYCGKFAELIKRHKDIKGVYVTTGYYGDVCTTIERENLVGKIHVIGTDYNTDLIKRFVKKNIIQAILLQRPQIQGRLAIRLAYNSFMTLKPMPSNQELVPLIYLRQILMSDSMEQDIYSVF